MSRKKPKTTRVRRTARVFAWWQAPALRSYDPLRLSDDNRAAALKFVHERMLIDRPARLQWGETDWQITEDTRERYVNGRSIELHSLPDNKEWESLVALVRSACVNLDEAIERRDAAAARFWKYIEDNPEQSEIQKGRLRQVIKTLQAQTNQSDAYMQKVTTETRIWVGDAWSKYVVRLSEQWQSKGLKPTAPKSDDQKGSAFVRWVEFLMRKLPEPLWQHLKGVANGNWGALNYEVSKALQQRKAVLKRIRRAEIDDIIRDHQWREGLRPDWGDASLQREYHALLADLDARVKGS
jgi:hypothetical protein